MIRPKFDTTSGHVPRIGIFLPTFAGGAGAHHDCPFYEQVDLSITRNFVLDAERFGFDSIWVCDHLMLGKENSILEGWTTLSYLGGFTRNIKLGSFVICSSYRNPALLAKMAATLDFWTGGRLQLGMGAGWHEKEYTAYGYEYPSAGKRIASLKEAIVIIKKMWTVESASFEGEYYKINNAVCNPKPIQKPTPPIMIGAFGEKMLRLTAEMADIWSIADDPSPEVIREKFEIISEYCRKEFRRDSTRNPEKLGGSYDHR